MTTATTEAKWKARVADWRRSGLAAPEFCEGKEYTASGLRYWASRLKAASSPPKEVRLARIVSASDPMSEDSAVVIEAGTLRIGVRRGFDPEVLRAVLLVVARAR